MRNFPTLVVDNFYDDVDSVRNFALSLPFNVVDETYPGKRTEDLSKISPRFFEYTCNKFFSLFFNVDDYIDWVVLTQFQLIYPYDKNKTNIKNMGWFHKDRNAVFAGIIYLTPEADIDTGTRFYKLKDGCDEKTIDEEQNARFKLYGNQNKIDDEYIKAFTNHRNSFEETLNVKNYYNRLVAFDSDVYHGVETYGSEIPRLTQVFFVRQIDTKQLTPLNRIRNFKFQK